jgi:large subunit ribosomal protein L9e
MTVKGKRGTVSKAINHIKVEITPGEEKVDNKTVRFITLNSYMTTYKQSAILSTVAKHIKNMIEGVTHGFRYKMHIVKKHFPIEIAITPKHLEVGRFLGGRDLKIVNLLEGVTCKKNEKNNEEIWLDGNDIDKVSLTCAHIYQSCQVQGKDKRKFLDGIYVNEKTTVVGK